MFVSWPDCLSIHHFVINNIHLYTQQRDITQTKTTAKSVTRIDGRIDTTLSIELRYAQRIKKKTFWS